MENQNKNILIVDDDQLIVECYSLALANQGFSVLTAENGQIGLDMAISKKPDLILLDINMPVMDGLTMLRELRKNDYGKNAAVILLTNLGADKEHIIKEIAESRPLYYIVKADFSIPQVVKSIKDALAIKS